MIAKAIVNEEFFDLKVQSVLKKRLENSTFRHRSEARIIQYSTINIQHQKYTFNNQNSIL
jgi:hypothetical protein